MNQNNVSLGRVTRKRMHEYYKNFVSDPDIFMDMSKYFEYQYSPERIDRYWETRKKPKDRKDFFVLLESEVIGELALKHIDFEKKECELSIHLQNDSVKNKGYGIPLSITVATRMLSKNAHNENLNNCGAGSTLVVLSRIMRKFITLVFTGAVKSLLPWNAVTECPAK